MSVNFLFYIFTILQTPNTFNALKKLLLLFISATLLMACSNDTGSDLTSISATFEGAWSMTGYKASTPEYLLIDEGDIVWDFDTEAQTVTMTNKGEPYMSPKGTFDYTLKEDTIVVALTYYDQKYSFVFDQQGLRLEGNNAVMRFEKL